jgi:hypothetical protein
VPYRLLRAISDFAEKHGEPGAGGATRITTPMREEDLAALIGADLRTVSRLLEHHENEGTITRSGSGVDGAGRRRPAPHPRVHDAAGGVSMKARLSFALLTAFGIARRWRRSSRRTSGSSATT